MVIVRLVCCDSLGFVMLSYCWNVFSRGLVLIWCLYCCVLGGWFCMLCLMVYSLVMWVSVLWVVIELVVVWMLKNLCWMCGIRLLMVLIWWLLVRCVRVLVS